MSASNPGIMVTSDKVEGDWELARKKCGQRDWARAVAGARRGDKGFVCSAELPGLVMVNIHPVTWWKHKAEEFCSND